MFLAILTIYIIILHLLKITYLLFEPKFLNAERFGPPSKFMLLVYYLIIICFLVVLVLEKLGVLQINITQIDKGPTFQFKIERNLVIALIIGVIAAIVHTIIEYKMTKKRRVQ